MAGRKRYAIDDIREAIRSPSAVDRVVNALYPDAKLDPRADAWMVADAAYGGAGSSCRFDRSGEFLGKFHDFNPGADVEHGDLIDAVRHARGGDLADALTFLGDLLGVSPRLSVVDSGPEGPAKRKQKTAAGKPEDLKPITRENLLRYRSTLRRTPEALAYLEARGLTERTMEHFWLGVLDPYPFTAPEEERVGPVIVSPIVDRSGRPCTPLPKTTVPNLTRNPRDKKGWCSGPPRSTWSGPVKDQSVLFVVEGPKDLWRLWQELADTSLGVRMALVSSTHGSGLPEEWKDRAFWQGWDLVYLGHDNDAAGEAIASKIRGLAGRDVLRVEVPRKMGKDWTDFFMKGGDVVAFEALLEKARPISAPIPLPQADETGIDLEAEQDGVYAAKAINVNGAFHNGRMYYPFRVRRTQTGRRRRSLPDGSVVFVDEKQFSYETMVVRSDGVSLGIHRLPAPHGTEDEDRIIALDDGTIITNIPRPGEFSTWSFQGIQSFLQATQEGKAPHRPLKHIVCDVDAFLRQMSWLPSDDDYALITAYVLMSHCFNAFDAIPQLLLNGEKGSGKSTTAEGIADLSYNGFVLGAGSEKAMVRFVDQGRGLLVLDDLEKVGRRGQDDGGFADINQILKLSYSKTAARKSVVDKTGATRVLDFYGPKVITNISGIDPVNASRMFRIMCRPMPSDVAESGRIRGRDPSVSEPLRQELHAWGMANAARANIEYRNAMETLGTRAKQIAAPLLVVAEMSGDPAFAARVRSAIERQTRNHADAEGPEDYLKIAVEELIAKGYRSEIMVVQIQQELDLIEDAMTARVATEVPPDLLCLRDVRWISRTMAMIGARRPGEVRKRRLNGQLVRVYDLDPDYVARVIEDRTDRGLMA